MSMLTALSNPGQMVINFSVAGAESSNCVISIFFSTAHFICKLRLNTWRKKKASHRKRGTLICFHCRVHMGEQTAQLRGQQQLVGSTLHTQRFKKSHFQRDALLVSVAAPGNCPDPGSQGCSAHRGSKAGNWSITCLGLSSRLI